MYLLTYLLTNNKVNAN